MKWRRWSGAGNTFYICDEWTDTLPEFIKRPQISRQLCSAFQNIPTDGVVFLQKSTEIDFKWDFYNADGSFAEMCGNAARCAAVHFQKFINAKESLEFETLAGRIQAEEISESSALIHMPLLQPVVENLKQPLFYVNTGVPHIVLEEAVNLQRAKELRPLPGGQGSNITFIKVQSDIECEAVTFERGVEDFTQACGTGATAAAVYMNQKNKKRKVKVNMPGGVLEVSEAEFGHRPKLKGPVELTFNLETVKSFGM